MRVLGYNSTESYQKAGKGDQDRAPARFAYPLSCSHIPVVTMIGQFLVKSHDESVACGSRTANADLQQQSNNLQLSLALTSP